MSQSLKDTHLSAQRVEKQKIVVVVIGYNEGKTLGISLGSALDAARTFEAATGQNTEVVYVDSGSTDDSIEIALRSSVRVCFAPALFHTCSNARMTGLVVTDSEYVMFLDGDMEISRQWLQAGAEFLDATPQAAGVAGIRDDMRATSRGFALIRNYHNINKDVQTVDKDIGGAFLLRRAALESIGGLEPDLAPEEDYLMYCRLNWKGWNLFRINQSMIVHWDMKVSSWRAALKHLLGHRRVLVPGVVLRRGLFHEQWALHYLWRFKRDLLIHVSWLVILCVSLLEAVCQSNRRTAALLLMGSCTLLYGWNIWSTKGDWPRVLAAIPLRTMYLINLIIGFLLNRPRIEFGIQLTDSYKNEILHHNVAR
jgi:glycosyltransferase involved in cell wall biosynthesis